MFTPPASIQEARPAQQPEAPGEEPAPEPVSPRMEPPAAADAPKGEPQEATDAASAEGAQVETLGAETPMPLESMVLEPMTLEIEAPAAEESDAEEPQAPPPPSQALPDPADVTKGTEAAGALEPLELEHEAEEEELPPLAVPEAPQDKAPESEIVPEPAQLPAQPEQTPEDQEPVFALEDLAPPPASVPEIPPVDPKVSGIPELPGLQAEQPAASADEPGKAAGEEPAPDEASLAADEFTFQLEETSPAVPLAETPPLPQEQIIIQTVEFPKEAPAPDHPAATSPQQPPQAEAVFTTPQPTPESPEVPAPPALSLDLQREILSRLAARHPLPGKEEPRPASDAAAAPRPAARPESRSPQAAATSAPPAPQAGSAARLGTSARQRPTPPSMGERPAERPIERPAERGQERRAERGAERRMDQPPASPLGQTLAGRSRREAKPDPTAPRPGIPQQHVHPAIFAKVRQYLEEHALSLTKVMVERALKGDSRCLVWCLDHVWPSPETPAPPLEIPPLNTPEEVAAFGAAIFQALSQGGLTLEQANGYMALLKHYTELLEMDEFKKRLLSLEQSLRGAGSGGGVKRQKITLGAFDKPF
ncbi:MAG: hypothetical protein LDL27_10775 [Desulfovibrio sp.]|nr:hypothetical protein [Desulfovibrio sp.]